MSDVYRATRQLERLLNVDEQGNYLGPLPCHGPIPNGVVVAIIVYDHEKQEVRIEAPPLPGGTGGGT